MMSWSVWLGMTYIIIWYQNSWMVQTLCLYRSGGAFGCHDTSTYNHTCIMTPWEHNGIKLVRSLHFWMPYIICIVWTVGRFGHPTQIYLEMPRGAATLLNYDHSCIKLPWEHNNIKVVQRFHFWMPSIIQCCSNSWMAWNIHLYISGGAWECHHTSKYSHHVYKCPVGIMALIQCGASDFGCPPLSSIVPTVGWFGTFPYIYLEGPRSVITLLNITIMYISALGA